MAYKPITVDQENLTLMGVVFPDKKTLNSGANAIGSNMFEGFEPTPQLIQFYPDWRTGKVKDDEFLDRLKEVI